MTANYPIMARQQCALSRHNTASEISGAQRHTRRENLRRRLVSSWVRSFVRWESSDGAPMVAVVAGRRGGGCCVRRRRSPSVLSREPVSDEGARLHLGQRHTAMHSLATIVWWRASWNSCAFTPRWIISWLYFNKKRVPPCGQVSCAVRSFVCSFAIGGS
jgi:hypothetical protein